MEKESKVDSKKTKTYHKNRITCNRKESIKIYKSIENDPYSAVKKYEEYIKRYPLDLLSRSYYALALVTIKEFDKAKKELGLLDLNNPKFKVSSSEVEHVKDILSFTAIKIHIHDKEFDKALELVNKYPDCDTIGTIHSTVKFYCMYHLGMYKKITSFNYIFAQISDYSKHRLKEHLWKHINELSDLIANNDNMTLFCEGFPISKIIDELKNILPSIKDRSIYNGYIQDCYYFKYNCCGKADENDTDYFAVVTFHDSDNIITMYPSNDHLGKKITDLNYLRKNKDNTKKLSQIDKFNKKYGL